MEAASNAAVKVLEALADINAILGGLGQQLRENEEVVRVSQNVTVIRYESGSNVEGYVDVELVNGIGLVWWLEANWTVEEWLVEARISAVDQNGQHEYTEFPTSRVSTLEALVQSLLASAGQLVSEPERALRHGLEWTQRPLGLP